MNKADGSPDLFIDALKGLHYLCIFYIRDKNLTELSLFLDHIVRRDDVNVLKTILVVCQGVRDNPIIKASLDSIQKDFHALIKSHDRDNHNRR